MKKWYLIGALALILVFIGVNGQQVISAKPVITSTTTSPSAAVSESDSKTQTLAAKTTTVDERRLGEAQRQQADIQQQLQQMWAALKQQNLQQWLHQLWAECESRGVDFCQLQWQAMRQQLSASELDWLQQLLQQYRDYQQLLAELVMDTTLSKLEQYDEVKRLRQRLFADDYDNLFALEEQWAMQQFEFGALLQQKALLDGGQRLQALYAQQQSRNLGVKQLQSADQLYQQAKDMLADLPIDERQYYLAQARLHYFATEAAAVAEFEAIKQQQEQHRLSYLQQVEVLQQQYQLQRQHLIANNASEAELQQLQDNYATALSLLRQQSFAP